MPATGSYIELIPTLSQVEAEDKAIEVLEERWENWSPNEANLEVVLIEAVASLATDANGLAAQMPAAALIAIGTKLLGLTFNEGTVATATATFTTAGTETVTIPAGAEINLNNIAFQTTAELTITAPATSGSIEIRANEVGEYANGLSGDVWSSVSLPLGVLTIDLMSATVGGSNTETPEEFLNRASDEMRLRAKSIITLIDYELLAIQKPAVGAATALAVPGESRNIYVYLKSPTGATVGTETKTELETEYAETRLVNAKVYLESALYDKIGVTWTGVARPGSEAEAIKISGNAVLTSALSPASWGNATSGNAGPSWVNQPIVKANRLIKSLAGVVGLEEVNSLTLEGSNIAELARPLTSTSNYTSLYVGSLVAGEGAGVAELTTLRSTLSTGSPITSLPINSLQYAIPSGAHIYLHHESHSQLFVTSAEAIVGATTISVTSETPGFAYPLTTTHVEGETTALANTVATNQHVVLKDPTGAHEQTIKVTGTTTGGWTVESFTANYSYPLGSTVSGPVTGNLTMPGRVALPEAGVMSATVEVAAE